MSLGIDDIIGNIPLLFLPKLSATNCWYQLNKSFDLRYKIAPKFDLGNIDATLANGLLEIFIPLADLIDLDKEVIRLKDKISDYEARIKSVKKKHFEQNRPWPENRQVIEVHKEVFL